MNRVEISELKERKKYNWVFLIFAMSFLLHIIPIIIIKTPTSGPDEVISLSSAANIAGLDWSYLVTKFGTRYGCGSAWFLAPLFYFISNGKVIYNLARVFLAIFLALQSVVCYVILKDFFECDNELEICIVSLVGSFFSNVTADIFCNESVLTLSTWLFIYFILKIYKYGNSFRYTLLLMGVFAYCYISHARALIFIPSILVIVIYLSIKKRKSFLDCRAIILGSCFLFIAWKINQFVALKLYNNQEALDVLNAVSVKQNSNYGLVQNFLLTIEEFGLMETLKGVLCVSATNMYALLIFTVFGIAVSFVCSVMFLTKNNKDTLINIVSTFCVVGLCISILAMGVINCWHGINLLNGNIYSDGRFFFYLRYYINFLPPMVIPMYICMKKNKAPTLIMKAIVLSLILYLAFEIVFYRVLAINGIEEFDVGKLFEAFSFGNTMSYSIAFKICLLINVFFILHYKNSNKTSIYFAMIFCLIMYQQMYQCIFFRGNISETTQECTDKLVELSTDKQLRTYLDDFGTLYVYSNKVYRLEYYTQLIMPEIQIKRFEESIQNKDNEKIIFSNEDLTSFYAGKLYCISLDNDEAFYTNSYRAYLDMSKIITQLEEK